MTSALRSRPVLVAPDGTLRRAGGNPPRRPAGGNGGGGGGGDGEGDRGHPRTPGSAGSFALFLALGGITTLFLVVVAVWWLLRRDALAWNGAGAPGATGSMWLSTLLLLASGLAVELAARTEGSRPRATRLWLDASLVLGVLFLLAQTRLWLELWRAGFVPARSTQAAGFFALTGLHALHVLGGLLFLAALTLRRRRAPARPTSVRLGAIYWHYMGALWLVLFTLLVWIG